MPSIRRLGVIGVTAIIATMLAVALSSAFFAGTAHGYDYDYQYYTEQYTHLSIDTDNDRIYVAADDDEDILLYGVTSLVYRGYSYSPPIDRVRVEAGDYTADAENRGGGVFAVSLPVLPVGTPIHAIGIYTDQDGTERQSCTYDDVVSWYPSEEYDDQEFWSGTEIYPTYKTSKKTEVILDTVTAGDYVKLKIGKKTYTKKIAASGNNCKITFKHKKNKAGTKIVFEHYNQFNQRLSKDKTKVYEGKKPKKGMTKKQVKNLYYCGTPDSSMSGSNGWWSWLDSDGSLWCTVYFKNNRVNRIAYW